MVIKFVSKNAITVTLAVAAQEAAIIMAIFNRIPDSEFICRPYLSLI